MTDRIQQKCTKSGPSHNVERISSVESIDERRITELITSTPLVDPNSIHNSRNSSPSRSRHHSSVSILRAHANTRRVLTTNDARKR